ncbi:MAG: S8 family peptidase [Nodosilinea sp.]
MSAFQLSELDVNPTSLIPSDSLGMDGSAQPAAYGLSAASQTTRASHELGLDVASGNLGAGLAATPLAAPHGLDEGMPLSTSLINGGEPVALAAADALTGLAPGAPLVLNLSSTAESTFEADLNGLTTAIDSADGPAAPAFVGQFDSASGYGLVDAAAAVSSAVGKTRFANVADIGGNQWNNDLINAPEAWRQGYTGKGVTVAVIDTGVDINHADLRRNIWVNADEIAGDGIDNDGNGYIDDRNGWNFGRGQNNGNVLPGTPEVGQAHGTHVAGTIAAAKNDIGNTGVAHKAKIMAIRMGDIVGNTFANAGNLAEAIRYAVDNGARVINMSLSWSDPDGSIKAALAYAAERNVVTVNSSGNGSRAVPGSLAQYATEYGISVGAVDRNAQITDFSNRAGTDSRLVHVMAPGQAVYSTLPNNTYGFYNGTSMAAPHVAGVVALMLGANPGLSASQVREILTGTSTLQATSNGLAAAVSADVPTTSGAAVQAVSSLAYFPVATLRQPAALDEPGQTGDAPSSLGLASLSIANLTAAALEGIPAIASSSTDDDWLAPLPALLGDDWGVESWG